MEFVVDHWGEDDTEEFATWFEFDTELYRAIGLPKLPTRGDLEAIILARVRDEINGLVFLRAVRQDGKLVGYVTVNPRHGVTGVCHIAIAPWMRGHGVEIAKVAVQAAREEGTLKKLVAIPYGIPRHLQERFLRAVGFTTHVMGEMEI